MAIDETHAGAREVFHAINLERVATCHHQALPACGHVDHTGALQVKPLCIVRQRLAFKIALRDVGAGQIAQALVQRHHGFLTADVFALDRGALLDQCVNQLFHRKTMAGVHAQGVFGAGEDFGQFGLQLRGQGFQHGVQARVDAVACPHQFFGQGRQGGAFAALHQQQELAQLRFTLANQRPGVAIRNARGFTGARQTAVVLDVAQQGQQPVREVFAMAVTDGPLRCDGNLWHKLYAVFSI